MNEHPSSPDACLEFLQGVIAAGGLASPAKDVDGRPCGELNAPEVARAGVSFEVRACPYPGSRQGKPMNVSALKQVTREWKELLSDVVALRSEYMRRNGCTRFSVWHLWRFGNIAAAMPAFLLRRAEDPIPTGALPARSGALFKAMQGIHMTTQHMLTVAGLSPADEVTVDRFIEHTESQGVFVTHATNHACSGPPHMVRDFVSAAILGTCDVERSLVTPAEVVGDMDAYFAYGAAIIQLVLTWALVSLESRLALDRVERLASELDASSPDSLGSAIAAFKAQTPRNLFDSPGSEEDELLEMSIVGMLGVETGEHRPFTSLGAGGVAASAHHVPALAELVRAHAPHLDPAEVKLVLPSVLGYLTFEREALEQFEATQRALQRALGRDEPVRLRGSDIERAHPTTLRSLFAKWTGLLVETSVGETSVASKTARIALT